MWTATTSTREKNKQTSADQELWHWLSDSLKHWVHTLKLVCLLDALAKTVVKALDLFGMEMLQREIPVQTASNLLLSLSPLLQARRLKCPFSVWQDVKWRGSWHAHIMDLTAEKKNVALATWCTHAIHIKNCQQVEYCDCCKFSLGKWPEFPMGRIPHQENSVTYAPTLFDQIHINFQNRINKCTIQIYKHF